MGVNPGVPPSLSPATPVLQSKGSFQTFPGAGPEFGAGFGGIKHECPG